MTRTRLYLALGLLLAFAGTARAQQSWQFDQLANGKRLKNLLAPGLGTEPLRLGDFPTGPCVVQANGTLPFICSTPVVPDDPFTIVSNHLQLKIDTTLHLTGGVLGVSPGGGVIAHPPLLLTGPDLTLTQDGTSIGTSGGALQRLALTYSGAITGTMAAGSGSLTTAFGTQSAASSFGNWTSSIAAPIDNPASTANTVPLFNGTVVGWSAIPPGATTGIVANWALPVSFATPNTRWFCLDGVSGSDSNVGWSDTSAADCGTKAVATAAKLDAIFPSDGRGRNAGILINSTTYAEWTPFLSGRFGYNSLTARATVTNATAGSVAFSDSTADRTMAGGVTATGMNASGYNPTGTPTTRAIQCLKVGGSGPSFPSETTFSIPGGARIRFDSATATTQLRNVSRTIVKVSGGDTLEVDNLLPAAPTASDVFYIEMPGAIFLAIRATGWANNNVSVPFSIAGMQSNGTLSGGTGIVTYGAVQAAFMWNRTGSFVLRNSISDLGSQYTLNGSQIETGGTCSAATINTLFSSTFTAGNTGTTPYANTILIEEMAQGSLSGSFVAVSGVILLDIGNVSSSNTSADTFGTTPSQISTGRRAARIIGTGLSIGSSATLGAIEFSGISTSAIGLKADGVSLRVTSSLTGSSGNTDVGLDLTGAKYSNIAIASTPTVTGTAGDIRLCDSTIITWTQAAAGVVDNCGNHLGTNLVTVLPSGTTLSGGTLTVPNLVGPGHTQVTSGGLFSVDSTTYVPTTRTLTMTAPMTCDGVGSCDLSANRTIATPVFAGSAAGLVPSSGGSSTLFLNAAGGFTAPAGTAGITATTGDVVATGPGSVAATIQANVVTNADIRQSGALAVVGRSANSTGNVADMQATAGTGAVMRESGSTVGFGALNLAASGSITGLLPLANLTPSGTNTWVLTTTGGVPVWAAPASGGANANGFYLVNQSTNAPTNAVNLGALATGSLYLTVSGSVATPSTINPYQVLVDGSDTSPGELAAKITTLSPIVTSVVSAGAPPSTGLVLRLEADTGVTQAGGVVSQWNDQSGNGYNVVASGTGQPVYTASAVNGKPGLTFNGTTNFMDNTTSNPVAAGTARTVVVVGYYSGSGSTSGSPFQFRRSSTNNFAPILGVVGTFYIWSDGAHNATITDPSVLGTPNTFEWYSTGTSGAGVTFSLTGSAKSVTGGGTVSSDSGTTGFSVGQREGGIGQFFKGTIVAVYVYDHVLSGTDDTTLATYIQNKWAIGGASVSETLQFAEQGAFVSGSPSTTPQNLGLLTTGIPKMTVTSGTNVFATATAGTDYTAGMSANATGPVCNTTGTGAVSACTSGALATALTMPAATDVLVSNSTTTAPVGFSTFTYSGSTLTSSGTNVLGSGTGMAYLTSGTLSAKAQPVVSTYHWSSAFVNSGTGLLANSAGFIIPSGDYGSLIQSSDGLLLVGGNPWSAIANAYGTSQAPMLQDVTQTFAGGVFSCSIWYTQSGGTGGPATLTFDLYDTTDESAGGSSSTLLSTMSYTVASAGPQNIGTNTFSTSIPSGTYLYVAAYRTDVNTLKTLLNLNFRCKAEMYK